MGEAEKTMKATNDEANEGGEDGKDEGEAGWRGRHGGRARQRDRQA